MGMKERLRRPGLIALSFLAGASLLRSSTALSISIPEPDQTLNFRLAEAAPSESELIGSDVWAIQGAPADSWRLAKESLPNITPRHAPDGLNMVALVVKVGRHHPRPVLTNAVTGLGLIQALGIELGKVDVVKPARDAALTPGMRFRVIRVRYAQETLTETLPYRTLIQYSKDMQIGETTVVTAGEPGTVIRTYLVTYQNGRQVARVVVSEDVVIAPVDQVVVTGNTVSEHGSQTGQASWYDFCNVDGNYAAHLTLPFGTVVTVRNLDNDQTVTVVINDRGPYGVPGRIIDLCDSAFAQIAPLSQGVADVEISW
jgi:surface rod structure-forming protein G/rare lipoprotein A (RlpA)-like double-psi beta-barrel protein